MEENQIISNFIVNELYDSVMNEIAFCRICYSTGSIENVLFKTTCKCTGSVGFIHLNCYKTWKQIRRGSLCEICKKDLIINYDNRSAWTLARIRLRRFFSKNYSYFCLKYSMNILCTIPMTYISLQNVYSAANSCNIETMQACEIFYFSFNLTITDIFMALNLLWSIKNIMKLCNTLSYWWNDIDEESYLIDDIENIISSDEE